MKYFILGTMAIALAISACKQPKQAMQYVPITPERYSDVHIVNTLPLKIVAPHFDTRLLNDSTRYYEEAYQELKGMLEGKSPMNFKRAVFIVENAYFKNKLSYQEFCNVIDFKAKQVRQFTNYDKLKNYHHFDDSVNVATNEAIYSTMLHPVLLSREFPVQLYTPYTYDFEDCFGEQDWTKTFVSKLLATHSGTCHSLPYLYKMIADETGASAFLALAPNHIYLKHKCQKYNGFNTELTNGLFPIDGWIMTAGYVSMESVRQRTYMTSLNDTQAITLCLYDLGEGYRHRFKNDTAKFILECADLALKYHPRYIDALQLKARTLQDRLDIVFGGKKLSRKNFLSNPLVKNMYLEMEHAYGDMAKYGYVEMPEKMYREWLIALENEKEKYTPKTSKKKIPFDVSNGRYDNQENYDTLLVIDNVVVSKNTYTIKRFIDRDIRPMGVSRWMSPDPLAAKYASVSPYVAFADNPVFYVDPDGRKVIPGLLTQGHQAAFDAMLKSKTCQEVFKDLLASQTYNVIVNTESLKKSKDRGLTSFYEDVGNGMIASNNTTFGEEGSMSDVGINATFKFEPGATPTEISGLAAAGTLFHELWHNKLSMGDERYTPDGEHRKMAADQNYFDNKLAFLEEVKGSKLTENEAIFNKWAGLEDTPEFSKAIYVLDKDGNKQDDGTGHNMLTEEGAKWNASLDKVDPNTGYEK